MRAVRLANPKSITISDAARGMDENEQDYWGTIEQIDGAVGRVRSLLRQHQRDEAQAVDLRGTRRRDAAASAGRRRSSP